MAEKPVFLTPEGKRKLQEELEYLRTVRRPQVAENIRQAKEGGDIMENVAYDAAKDEQAFVEGRIMTLEALLKNAVIIEEPTSPGVVTLGSKVTVREGRNPPETFHIVGAAESDPANGRISNESPLGRALMGHKKGDLVYVQTPDGKLVFRLLNVE